MRLYFALAFMAACHAPSPVEPDPIPVVNDTRPCHNTVSYRDRDGDGWGDSSLKRESCDAYIPDGWTRLDGDCNDSNIDIHPKYGLDVHEVDDGIDDDCDGQVDEDWTWAWRDGDGDGFPRDEEPTRILLVQMGLGLVTAASFDQFDCDDGDPFIFPGATERVANGTDEDCDGAELCYLDADNDGYGSPEIVIAPDASCDHAGMTHFNSNDCDDSREDVNLGSPEFPDGADNDCDGSIDEFFCSLAWQPRPTGGWHEIFMLVQTTGLEGSVGPAVRTWVHQETQFAEFPSHELWRFEEYRAGALWPTDAITARPNTLPGLDAPFAPFKSKQVLIDSPFRRASVKVVRWDSSIATGGGRYVDPSEINMQFINLSCDDGTRRGLTCSAADPRTGISVCE